MRPRDWIGMVVIGFPKKFFYPLFQLDTINIPQLDVVNMECKSDGIIL